MDSKLDKSDAKQIKKRKKGSNVLFISSGSCELAAKAPYAH